MKIFTTLILLSLCTIANQFYTMQDLKILADQNENVEYLEHAKDITPSKRDANWKKLTLKVAIKLNNDLSKKRSTLSNKEIKLINSIDKWPALKSDISYLESKKALILKQLKDCIKQSKKGSFCLDFIKPVYLKNLDPQLGIELTDLLNKSYPMVFKADELLPFTKEMLGSNVCEFYINKKPLSQIITSLMKSKLGIFYDLNIDKDCKTLLSKDILIQLYTTSDSDIRKSSKMVLQKWGSLHSNDIYFYNIAQFLDNYSFPKNKLFVKWKTFKTLSKNSKTRDLIISKLMNKRPLLGKVLYNESKESSAVIDALSRTIPEYFTNYAKLCISYFQGKIDAPSADCHQLFKANNKLNLFSKSYSLQYKQIVTSWKK